MLIKAGVVVKVIERLDKNTGAKADAQLIQFGASAKELGDIDYPPLTCEQVEKLLSKW